jgi:hypothetical protein
MNAVCLQPIADYDGNVLFYVGKSYSVVEGSQKGHDYYIIKDERKCMRHFAKDKTVTKYFKFEKEQPNE